MEALLGFFLGLAGLVGGFVLLWKTAAWILRPLDLAAKGRESPLQFTLGDFLGLTFLAQVPMGALLLDHHLAWGFVIFGWIAFGLMWLAGVQTLSRAGVENPWHRALFVGLVIPGSVCGTIALVPVLVFGLVEGVRLAFGDRRDIKELLMVLGVGVGLGAVLYAFGLLTRRMLARRRPTAEDAVDDSAAPRSAAPDPFADDEEGPPVT